MFRFERRDGLARLGWIELEGYRFESPMMIDFTERPEFVDKIDFGFAPYVLKDFDEYRFRVLRSKDLEITVVTGLNTLSPRKLVETLIEVRKSSFKPLYAVSIADPKNLPLLVYMGVDIVDNIIPILKAYSGVYMLENVEFKLDDLKFLPCNCPVCHKSSPEDMDEELLAKHNTFILEKQLKTVRILIKNQDLRNFIEAQSKFNPELTAMLRILDEKSEFIEKFYPIFKKTKMYANTSESFGRPEVVGYFKRALEAYKPEGNVLLILPCSARKPYSLSRSHKRIRGFIDKTVEEIIVSSPLVVPREFELTYPAVNYDVPVTGYWSDDEISFVSKKLSEFIEKGDFDAILAHVEGGYRRVVERIGFDVIWTSVGDVTSPESLKKLRDTLDRLDVKQFDLYKSIFRHMFRYQFGIELDLDFDVRGRYPNLEAYSERRIARIDLNYGMLDIDIPIAKILIDRRVYFIEIEDFEPKGTIFSAGIKKADKRIRPNDIIAFYNSRVIGVGRALMSGEEMTECEGKAVEVRRMERID